VATNLEDLENSEFCEHGKLREISGNSVQPRGKIVTKKVFVVCHSNICVKQLLACYIAGVDVELPLMKVIITLAFCCDNLWKSKFVALEKPGKLWELFFAYFVATL